MTRGVPDTTARYDRSVYVAKLQSDGEPAYEPAMNRIRPSRVLVLLLRTHTRRKTLQSALQVLQVPAHIRTHTSHYGTVAFHTLFTVSTELHV